MPSQRGVNHVQGQVGLVRSISASVTSSGSLTVQPSAIWRTGPRPLTRFRRIMVTHIGGLNAVVDTVLNLPKIPGGKKLIYNHIELPLTAICDFGKLGESDPMFAELDKICKAHNNLWSAEAERYLLENGKAL